MNEGKYQEFHRLRDSIISKLLSIQEGSAMNSFCDDVIEDTTVIDQVNEVSKEALALSFLAKELSEEEGL